MAELRQIAEAVEAEKRGVLSNDRRAALQEIRNRAAGSKKTLINYIEPLLTIGSAAISEPVSGFVGMAGLPFGVDAASSAIKRTQDAMTYQPRTQGGKEVMQDIGNLIAPVVEPLQRGAEWMGDTTLDVTGSPALATAVRTGLEVAPDMVGGKILSKIPGRKLEAGDLAASGGQMGRQRGAVAGAEANSLSSLWKDRGIKSSVSERSDSIILNQMVVPKSNRGRGAGTQAMQELIDYADSIGKRVDLSPSADFGGNKNRLTEFYKRFGFVENKGKSRDFEVSESMYRPASANPEQIKTNNTISSGQIESD